MAVREFTTIAASRRVRREQDQAHRQDMAGRLEPLARRSLIVGAAADDSCVHEVEYRIPLRDGARLFTSVLVPKDTSTTYPFMAGGSDGRLGCSALFLIVLFAIVTAGAIIVDWPLDRERRPRS